MFCWSGITVKYHYYILWAEKSKKKKHVFWRVNGNRRLYYPNNSPKRPEFITRAAGKYIKYAFNNNILYYRLVNCIYCKPEQQDSGTFVCLHQKIARVTRKVHAILIEYDIIISLKYYHYVNDNIISFRLNGPFIRKYLYVSSTTEKKMSYYIIHRYLNTYLTYYLLSTY